MEFERKSLICPLVSNSMFIVSQNIVSGKRYSMDIFNFMFSLVVKMVLFITRRDGLTICKYYLWLDYYKNDHITKKSHLQILFSIQSIISSIPSSHFVDEANHRNIERDPFPSRTNTPRRILLGSFVVDPPFFDNVVSIDW